MGDRNGFVRTWWFSLLGDKIVVAAVLGSFAPAAFSMWLFKHSQVLAGAVLGTAWLLLFTMPILTLQRRRLVRLSVSIAGALIILAVLAFVFATEYLTGPGKTGPAGW
jgi:hypothetical protein